MAPVFAAIGAQLTAAFLTKILVSTVISIAFSYISKSLAPKPKAAGRDRGVTQLIRASAEPHKIIYGERLVSGVLTFAATEHSTSGGSPTGDNLYLHIVVSLAGHQVDEIKTVYLNDVGVDDDDLDANGLCDTGRFNGFLRLKKHLGLWDQAADTHMLDTAADGGIGAVWTSAHQGKNIAYIYLRMTFHREVYPTGIPNIKALVKGRLVADPRDTAISITSTSVADPSVVTTGSAHGLVAGDRCFITNHAGSVPTVYGEYAVLSAPTTTTFTIDVNVTTGGTGGTLLQMKWNNNAALCLRDYLLADFGIAADQTDEMDDTAATTAADVCDEEVLYPAAVDTFDFTAATSDILTQTVAVTDPVTKPKPLHPFDGVEFTTTGTLPAGLSLATRYWVFNVGGKSSPFTFQVASSLANARAGTTIDITDTGTGTHTLTRKSQPRYTSDGVFWLDNDPIDIVPELIDPTGGILTYTQGRYTMFAGAWNGPATVTLTEDDLRGELVISPKPGKADIHNGVRGIFHDRDNKWEPTDFHPVSDATAVANDGGEKIWKEVVFTFVTDQHRAQRLAWLINRRMRPPTASRHSTIVEVSAKLTALQLAVGDVVDMTIDRLGWVAKEFEVVSWTLGSDAGIGLVLKESASSVYSFDPENDEVIIDPAPNTRLQSAFDPPADLTGLTLTSGTSELLAQADGTVVSRIKVTWDDIVTGSARDISVTEGGRIEIQSKKSADSVWDTAEFVAGETNQFWVSPVLDGTNYDVRVRAINRLLVPSANWTTVSSHTVAGKSAAPSNVSGLALAEEAGGIRLTWTAIADADLKEYEIRTGNVAWASATHLAFVKTDNFLDTRELTATTLYYKVKAIDTSGTESATADAANITIGTPAAPTGLALASGGAHLLQTESGDFIPRIRVTWTNSVSALVAAHQIRWKKNADSNYDSMATIEAGTGFDEFYYITGVEAGTSYDVTIRAVSSYGLAGSSATVTGHTVVGKAAAPANVTGLSLTAEVGGIRLTWSAVADVDLRHYEIRTGNVAWASATHLAFVNTDNFLDTRELSATTLYYKVKAVDTSGNESATSNDANITIAAPVAPTGLVLASGGAHLLQTESGELIPRILVTWTDSVSPFLQNHVVSWKKNADSLYDSEAAVDNGIERYYITGVEAGTAYDVRLKAITTFGLTGAVAASLNHTVVGKTGAPANVTNFADTQGAFGDCLTWDAVADVDLRHYEIRHGIVSWAASTLEAKVLGTSYNAGFTPSTKRWRIKAIDTSGNESVTEAELTSSITGPTNSSLTGTIRHDSVLLEWTNSAGSYPIQYTEIRRGAVFASATVVAQVTADAVTLTGQPAGSQTYWVRSTDMAGNNATEQSVNPTVQSRAHRLIKVTLHLNADGTTFTKQSDTVDAWVECVGPGGGGGGSNNTNDRAGGGGGGGEYAAKYITGLSATTTVSVGTGGAAGTGTTDGAAGSGATTWDTTVVVANAGAAGREGSQSPTRAAGGSGGTGDIVLPGRDGGAGQVAIGSWGSGGNAGGGKGNGGVSLTNTAGQAGGNYGGGGSGGHNSSTARAGGAGADGCIIVWEYG